MTSSAEPGKFNAQLAVKGYALNKMCHTLNRAENRAEFIRDEAAYCARFGLSPDEQRAVIERNKPAMLALGGNMYFLAKLDRVKKPDVKSN